MFSGEKQIGVWREAYSHAFRDFSYAFQFADWIVTEQSHSFTIPRGPPRMAPPAKSRSLKPGYGYLWIGSQRGLFRLDGVQFEQYEPPPGVTLPSYDINSLMVELDTDTISPCV